jgi:saccharopine dehydrogenase-like NADP-dependent oxidoreductase
MHILVIGASGMVGQAALFACAQDERVSRITAIVRRPMEHTSLSSIARLHEVVCPDLFQLENALNQPNNDLLGAPDACLCCAGSRRTI